MLEIKSGSGDDLIGLGDNATLVDPMFALFNAIFDWELPDEMIGGVDVTGMAKITSGSGSDGLSIQSSSAGAFSLNTGSM